MNSSDLFRFLKARSSVREYSGEPLDPEDIEYILAAASTAPSAGNREAWDVVVVTDEDIRLELALAALEQVHVRDAPAVFVVCANYVRSMTQYGERGILYAVEDAAIACTYMMLAAHARDLHSCWTGAFEEDEVRELLGLPQHIRPVALLAVGKGTPPLEPMKRMPVDEHVHRETW
ncbi:nitroreductase [Methanoculleus sp. Wushi-C6]|uniref:Nitroreductase n=1 Tax=Methanoculleus caldifontis TaxID=2651577 RepID=A0ABU3X192_9EURY|nr:nitroreductase family protein [Methanoculleus sp. Wushi-C6]MDV2481828.1 nitroreductase [Methanoculleus sp. Wushi-C6]